MTSPSKDAPTSSRRAKYLKQRTADEVVSGNVGAAYQPSQRSTHFALWVESRTDGYRHNLFLTKDEVERLIDAADRLLDTLDGAEEEVEDN